MRNWPESLKKIHSFQLVTKLESFQILTFVFPGCLLTTGFLVNGLFKFGRRDMAGSQVMMRGRIAAQVGRGGV